MKAASNMALGDSHVKTEDLYLMTFTLLTSSKQSSSLNRFLRKNLGDNGDYTWACLGA